MATVRKRTWNKGTPNEKTAWIADYFDQQGDRHIKTFPRQAEAKAWLAETTIQVKQGTHTAERQSITVAQAAELWFENRRDIEKARNRNTQAISQSHSAAHRPEDRWHSPSTAVSADRRRLQRPAARGELARDDRQGADEFAIDPRACAGEGQGWT